jgi:hypothetical protein
MRRSGTAAATFRINRARNAFNGTNQGEDRMSHRNTKSTGAGAQSALYKPDHPRWIDYHIDFFGDDTPARLTAIALCGEVELRLPA